MDNIEIKKPAVESKAITMFRAKCETVMAEISNYKKWEDEEEMVHEVMEAGRTLFSRPLDKMPPNTLLNIGGRLVGSFGYLGQRSSYARAERDVYEAKLDELEKTRISQILKLDPKYKVTQARADVAIEFAEMREIVIQKETAKNQWEKITEACSSMIMFIQSAMKTKNSEQYTSNQLHNNS